MSNYTQYGNVSEPDVPLSAFAVSYSSDKLIADMVCPRIPVSAPAGTFYKSRKRDIIQTSDDRMGVNGSPGFIDSGYDEATFSCKDYGLQSRVMKSVQRAADAAINPFRQRTQALTAQILTNHEIRVASLLTTSTNYATNNYEALAGGDRWDTSTGNPIEKVLDRKKHLWTSPSAKQVAWCGYEAYVKLRSNPFVREFLGDSGAAEKPSIVTKAALAAMFEVDEFVVGAARKDSGAIGGSSSEALIWGKNFGVVVVEPTPSLESIQFAATWTFMDRRVFTWEDPEPGLEGAWRIKVTHSCDIGVVASDAAIMLATVIS